MNELSEKSRLGALSSISRSFVEKATYYFQGTKLGSERASKLAIGAAIAANTAVENGGIQWSNVDAKKFVTDMLRCIEYQLDFGNKEVYVIPYKNSKTGMTDLTTSISADGLVKLARMFSVKPIKDIKKYIVREGDEISISHGDNGDSWNFNPNLFSSKPAIGYFTVVIYEDGVNDVEVTTKEDVEKRRKASKSPNSPAWANWYDEMALAKAIRKHMKRISIALPVELDDESEYEQVTKDMGEVIVPKIELESESSKTESIESTVNTVSDEELFAGTPFEM